MAICQEVSEHGCEVLPRSPGSQLCYLKKATESQTAATTIITTATRIAECQGGHARQEGQEGVLALYLGNKQLNSR